MKKSRVINFTNKEISVISEVKYKTVPTTDFHYFML